MSAYPPRPEFDFRDDACLPKILVLTWFRDPKEIVRVRGAVLESLRVLPVNEWFWETLKIINGCRFFSHILIQEIHPGMSEDDIPPDPKPWPEPVSNFEASNRSNNFGEPDSESKKTFDNGEDSEDEVETVPRREIERSVNIKSRKKTRAVSLSFHLDAEGKLHVVIQSWKKYKNNKYLIQKNEDGFNLPSAPDVISGPILKLDLNEIVSELKQNSN